MSGQQSRRSIGRPVLRLRFIVNFFSACLFELAVVELGVEAALCQELLVIATLHDIAVSHDKDDVGVLDC